MKDTFIGIDLGTSGCRACLIDGHEHILQQSQVSLLEPEINGQCVEQDPALWWQAVLSVLTEITQHPGAQHLKAIAVDGTSSSLLVTDSHYLPVAPALMYNDARATEEALTIEQQVPEQASAVFGPSSSLSKLLWLVKHYPEAQKALHQADYIIGQLSGCYVSDFNNSLKLGFDPVSESWPNWLSELRLPENMLPEVLPPGTVIGQLTQALQKKLGLTEAVQIVTGTTDSIAGFLATGASQTGDAVVSIGSTIAIKVLSKHPVNNIRQGIYSHKINQQWLVGGASNAGTTVLRQLFDDEQLQTLSQRLDFDQPTGLNYYPIPKNGERFPSYDPEKSAVLSPRPDNDAVFLQGILESLTHIEQQCYQALTEKGASTIKRLFTIGGASINKKWMAYRASVLGYDMQIPQQTEACFGTARLARQGYNQLMKNNREQVL